MGYLLSVGVVVLVFATAKAGPYFDFEDTEEDFKYFKTTGAGCEIEPTKEHAKSGERSLKWTWDQIDEDTKLIIELRSAALKGKALKGGMKMWVYIPQIKKEAMAELKMTITFLDTKDPNDIKSSFPVTAYFGFFGWRAIWIPFKDFKTETFKKRGVKKIHKVEFKLSPAGNTAGELLIDLCRFTDSVVQATRDRIVPVIEKPVTEEWDDKEYWQQTLRWSLYTDMPEVTKEKSDKDPETEIMTIESRLDNFFGRLDYCLYTCETQDKEKPCLNTCKTEDESEPSEPSEPSESSESSQRFDKVRAKRWQGLLKSISTAHNMFERLKKTKDGLRITGPPLFAKKSEFGDEKLVGVDKTKFTFIFEKILLPFALEYYLRSRVVEVRNVIDCECKNLKSDKCTEDYDKAIMNIAGSNSMAKYLKERLKDVQFNCDCDQTNLTTAIKYLNDERLRRFVLVMEYLEDQGWASGSGLGSLDHEMNKNGAGFINSLYLTSHALKETCPEQHKRWLLAAKWFTDFNEIHQEEDNYIYEGSTADRIRTLALFRLMVILMMPPKDELQNRTNEMYYYRTSIQEWLKINKGLGGLIKPDYTGFHHMTFYGAAYISQAYHNVALIQYLLGGTSFALNKTATGNLLKAMQVLRMTAPKYSTPNGICGRMPGYSKGVLLDAVPAYAYISYIHGSTDAEDSVNSATVGMFLRLYDESYPAFRKVLEKGEVKSSIYYHNSMGAYDIMIKVKKMSEKSHFTPEPPPSGHWSKNFAALSIHRRQDWVVAAKGFNRYVWDYESNAKENVFGIFGSYGSLQISNNEAALKSYDVKNGWRWQRVPGATTINLELENIKTKMARYYNRKDFVGGVSMQGSAESPQNGVFGMEFEIPEYEVDNAVAPLNGNIDFTFKKSFFFFDDLIVCLGSNIDLSPKNNLNSLPEEYYPQTTLFQDKLLRPNDDTKISVGSQKFDLRSIASCQGSDDGSAVQSDQEESVEKTELEEEYQQNDGAAKKCKAGDIIDTHGNVYRILEEEDNELNVEISDQKSIDDGGCKKTKGRYATAWLKHKSTKGSYGYAVLVKGTQEIDVEKFDGVKVLQKDSKAHIVSFENFPGQGSTTNGYSIFKRNKELQGPVVEVSNRCLIMIEETSPQDQDEGMTENEDQGMVGDISEFGIYKKAKEIIQGQSKAKRQGQSQGHGQSQVQGQSKGQGQSHGQGQPRGQGQNQTNGLANKVQSPEAEDVDDSVVEKRSSGGSCSGKTLHIAISNPAITFKEDTNMESTVTCKRLEKDNIIPTTSKDVTSFLLFCVKGKSKDITVTLKCPVSSEVTVLRYGNSEDDDTINDKVTVSQDGTKVTFLKLKDGLTTEAIFQYL